MAANRNLPDMVDHVLARLPDEGEWATANDGSAVFALVPGEVLFVVTVDDNNQVTVTSRPLRGERIVVRFELGRRRVTAGPGAERETHWTFRYVDVDEPTEAWQRITGVVWTSHHGERVDERERLARSIASKAGWSFPPSV